MATKISNAAQGDYRLAQQCGADEITAADVAVSYRLDGADRPIERVGDGWSEFGIEAGTVLENASDVEEVRRLLAGRDPHSPRQLVKPKVAVHPQAMLPAKVFVAALESAAADRGLSVEQLVAGDPWSTARVGRLERALLRDGEHHRAPVADLERVAAAAGIGLEDVFEDQELKYARTHRDQRVQVGVMGYDITFDRPKGISVLQGLAPEHIAARMERIHLEAVRESVAALQGWAGYAMAGHHGDGQTARRLDTSGLIGTMTVHRTARPVDGQPGDPHLHTHVMLANLARGEDGKWRTIAAGGRDLMRHVPAVGELYRALERAKLSRELGVRFEQDPRTNRWDVVGVPPSLRSVFSRRAQQIRAVAGEGATAAQGRAAGRASARAKVASTPASERASWHERAQEAGHDPALVVAAALGQGPEGPTTGRGPGGPQPGPQSPDELAAAVWHPETGVTAHTKVVTRAKILAHVAGALGVGLPSAAMLEMLTDHVLADGRAVVLPEAGTVHMSNASRYTSADIPAAERVIMTAAADRLGAGKAIAQGQTSLEVLKAWQKAKGFALSEEQVQVIGRLIGHGHGIDTVLGVAGAGKTTIMSAARTAWEASGLRVEGAAVAAVAAAGLRAEAGIASRTVASWQRRIATGPGLEGVDVLVLDEAAMVGDRDLAALVDEAGRTGTKLVMIGDPLQLKSVAAGGSFTHVHQAVDGAELHENRRQRSEIDRQTLEAWRTGARRSALAMWGERGMVRAAVDADAALGQMAAGWWEDRSRLRDAHDAVERVLMLAATNADVEQLNTHGRAFARAEGLLTGPDTTWTLGSGERLALAAGDQARMRANDYRSRSSSDPDVLNGYRGLIREVDPTRGALFEWRRADTLEQAWITPEAITRGDLSHGYASTIASAQGLTCDRAHVYGLGADAHGLYAAMSRARERTDLYLPALEVEPDTVRQRRGEARSEAEQCARVIAAYADTLTDDETGLVLAELEEAAPPLGEVVPARPDPAADHEPPADGQVPEHETQAAQAAALRETAKYLRDEVLPLRRQEYRLAEQRAEIGRIRLLLDRTKPSTARTAAHQARERIHQTSAQVSALRAQARELSEQAKAGRERQEREAAQAEQRRRRLEKLEPTALSRGMTRAELAALDTDQLPALEIEAARADWLASQKAANERAARIPRTPPRSPSHSHRPPTHTPKPTRGYGYGR
ncbi:MobF family relaxase [Nocardiopsis sp. CT-R113]|uniref:MobF family relaxase n=1 Tax=Nocardiopsis codii TaxID=3065942 RepID=A0ABU7KF92_9ACTN|nr:MobF family relaxase [Nocardiopsis sp. CT-R113]MEE2040883.1 MobF family relaxase [Nocardiopsis sp. CT-R113]